MHRLISRGSTASRCAAPAAACTRSSPVVSGARLHAAPGSIRRIHATTILSQSTVTLPSTTTNFPTNHGKVAAIDTPYFIDNKFFNSATNKYIDVHDPATNNLITRIPEMTDPEMKAAVASAEKAFESWSKTTALTRQQIMFRFVQLIRENFDRLAASCTIEQGKTLADSRGDVLRGIQVAEAAIAAPELLKGELLEVSKDMETRTYREPLGVVAAICPFSECFQQRGHREIRNTDRIQTSLLWCPCGASRSQPSQATQ